jgi:aconitate hydratase
MPAGAKILPYRSNIPYLAKYCFEVCDKAFPNRAKAAGGGFIIGGENYGQGSSREHAALVPLWLGVKAVIAKSFARIHKANLINSGILPLTFKNERDYDLIDEGDVLCLKKIRREITEGGPVFLYDKTKNIKIELVCDRSERQAGILLAGGLLNYTKNS